MAGPGVGAVMAQPLRGSVDECLGESISGSNGCDLCRGRLASIILTSRQFRGNETIRSPGRLDFVELAKLDHVEVGGGRPSLAGWLIVA